MRDFSLEKRSELKVLHGEPTRRERVCGGDTSRVVNIRLFTHKEGMGAEELWNQSGNKVAMVTAKLLQTPVCV